MDCITRAAGGLRSTWTRSRALCASCVAPGSSSPPSLATGCRSWSRSRLCSRCTTLSPPSLADVLANTLLLGFTLWCSCSRSCFQLRPPSRMHFTRNRTFNKSKRGCICIQVYTHVCYSTPHCSLYSTQSQFCILVSVHDLISNYEYKLCNIVNAYECRAACKIEQ